MVQVAKKIQRSIADLDREANEAVQSEMDLHKGEPAGNIVEHVLKQADPSLISELSRMTLVRDLLGRYARLAAIKKKVEWASQRDFAFHSFRIRELVALLPPRLQGADTETSALKKFIKSKADKVRLSRENDLARAAALEIIALTPKADVRAHRKVTLAKIDEIKAKEEGLL